jgi:hypothetical protein
MKRGAAVRRVGLHRRPTGATGSIVKNEHPEIEEVLVFRDRSDRAASLRDARRTAAVRSTSVALLLCGDPVLSVFSVPVASASAD